MQTSPCPSMMNNISALFHNNALRNRNNIDTSYGARATAPSHASYASPQTTVCQSQRNGNLPGRTAQAIPSPHGGNSATTVLPHVRNCSLPPHLFIPDEPPMVPRRPPRRGNCRETLGDIAKRVPLQVMCPYFNYPLSVAAKVCVEVTRSCRRKYQPCSVVCATVKQPLGR